MLELYFHPSPNPLKVALYLEEVQSKYELKIVDTFRGDQHEAEFLALNPNAKVPVLVDGDTTVFDSAAILLYLADRDQRFIGTRAERASVLSWLMFISTGLSPFSGQAVHFLHHAAEKLPYAQRRYLKEVERHYRILDRRLASSPYVGGSNYSIADMAAWGWMSFAHYILGEAGLSSYPNVNRLYTEISSRSAAQRVQAIRQATAVKTDFDEETRRSLFPTNY
jgi:GSH-dependent disulfide-bond oxidoreductase